MIGVTRVSSEHHISHVNVFTYDSFVYIGKEIKRLRRRNIILLSNVTHLNFCAS